MARRIRNHRIQLDRAGISALTGASSATISHWQAHHPQFPAKAATDPGGRDWWWRTDIERFWRAHLAARTQAFTVVDRRGDPDDLLNAPQAAKVLGYRSHRNLPKVLLVQPDHIEPLPSGRLRRYWRRSTLWHFADGRPLRHSTGRPPGTLAHQRQPYPYADDPRLKVAIAMVIKAQNTGAATPGLGATLAARLGVSRRTGERLINAARRQLSSSS
jgi:hypothetical protein